MFERAERGTRVVPCVALLHKRYRDASPLRHTDDPLGQPRRTGVPPPQSVFFKEWLRQQNRRGTAIAATESPVAELFVFESTRSSRKLEAFVWTIEYVEYDWPSLYYAFLLQVVDM